MTSNISTVSNTARANKAKLNRAMNGLQGIQADPSLLKGRTVVDVNSKMDVKKLDIATFLTLVRDLKPVVVQRNDRYRLNNGLAAHLDSLELPQCMFALVYWNGQLWLVDGNTRKRAWLSRTEGTVPSHVWVTVMVPDDAPEIERIYNCFDSSAAKKTFRDSLSSLMREAGLDVDSFTSKVTAGAKWATVWRNMLKAHVGGRVLHTRKLAFMTSLSSAIVRLDRHGLDERSIRGGALWAILRLYTKVPAQYSGVVSAYVEELKKLETPMQITCPESVLQADQLAKNACHLACVGLSGEGPIPVMFPHYLTGFQSFCLEMAAGARRHDKDFKRFVTSLLAVDVIEPDVEAAAVAQATARAKKARSTARKLSKTVTV